MKKLLVVTLLLSLFSVAAQQGDKIEEFYAITQKVLLNELKWSAQSEIPPFEIVEIRSKVETYEIDLELNTTLYTIALLPSSKESLPTQYEREVRTLIRYNMEHLLSSLSSHRITDVTPSGYWSLSSLSIGKSAYLVDANGKPFGLVVASEHHEYEDKRAVLLDPIWSTTVFRSGMGLKEGGNYSLSFAFNASYERLGGQLGFRFPIKGTQLRGSTRLSIDHNLFIDTTDWLLFAGLSRYFSLALFRDRIHQKHSWWENIQLEASVHIGGGRSYFPVWGSQVALALYYQSSAHLRWGFEAAYRFLSSTTYPMQANERAIVLCPTVAVVW